MFLGWKGIRKQRDIWRLPILLASVYTLVALISVSAPPNWDETLEFFWLRDSSSFSAYLSKSSSSVCASWLHFLLQGGFYKFLLAVYPVPSIKAIYLYRIIVLGSLYSLVVALAWMRNDGRNFFVGVVAVLPLLTVQSVSYGVLARWYGLSMPMIVLWILAVEDERVSLSSFLSRLCISALVLLIAYANLEAIVLLGIYLLLYRHRKLKKSAAAIVLGVGIGMAVDWIVRRAIGFNVRGCASIGGPFSHNLLDSVWSSGVAAAEQITVQYGFWALVCIVLFSIVISAAAFILDGGQEVVLRAAVSRVGVVIALFWGLVFFQRVVGGKVEFASHNWPAMGLLIVFSLDMVQLMWHGLRSETLRRVFVVGLLLIVILHAGFQIHGWGRKIIDRPGFDGEPLSWEIAGTLRGGRPVEIYSPLPPAPISLLRAYLEDDIPSSCSVGKIAVSHESEEYAVMKIKCSGSGNNPVKYVLFANCDPASQEPEKYGWRLVKYVSPGWRGWSKTCLYRFKPSG